MYSTQEIWVNADSLFFFWPSMMEAVPQRCLHGVTNNVIAQPRLGAESLRFHGDRRGRVRRFGSIVRPCTHDAPERERSEIARTPLGEHGDGFFWNAKSLVGLVR